MALSDFLAPALQVASTVLSAGSQLTRGASYRTVGARRQAAKEFEAKQLELEAEQSRGVGLRGAQDEVMRAGRVNSAALARAAASGAGASDPTVVNIIARTAGEGAYRAAVNMYEGEAQARMDLLRAAAARFEGETGVADASAASRAAGIGAVSTVLSGATRISSMLPAGSRTMYDKYWTGPRAVTAKQDTYGA